MVGDVRGSWPLSIVSADIGCVCAFTSFPVVGLVMEGRCFTSTDGFDSVKLPSTSAFTATSACCDVTGDFKSAGPTLRDGTESALDEAGTLDMGPSVSRGDREDADGGSPLSSDLMLGTEPGLEETGIGIEKRCAVKKRQQTE